MVHFSQSLIVLILVNGKNLLDFLFHFARGHDIAFPFRQAAQFLVFACAGIPLKTYSMLVNGAFAGAGATRVSCKVNCVTMWALQLPLAWTLGNAFGATGIYAAMLCANAGSAFWYARLYAGKKWLEYGMRKRQNA